MSADDEPNHGIVCFSCGDAYPTLRGYWRHKRISGCSGGKR